MDIICEMLKPIKDWGLAAKSVDDPNNVPDLHWKFEPSQINYSGSIYLESGSKLSNDIDKGTPNTSQLSEKSTSVPTLSKDIFSYNP